MRKPLVARLTFALTAFAAIGVWVACGGSDATDVTADAGVDAGKQEQEDSAPPVTDSGSKDATPTDSGPARDAGPPVIIFPDGGPFADSGIPCYVGGQLEEEPNNDKDTANLLAPIRCGFINVPDGGTEDGGESDWLKFELGDASTGFFVRYEGSVKVVVETDGMAPVDITQPGASIPVFAKGQPYFVQVRSATGTTQLWKVILFEDK